MGERLPDLLPPGDHHALGIQDAKACQRHLLGLADDRRQSCADLDIGWLRRLRIAACASGRRRNRSLAVRSSAGRIGVTWSPGSGSTLQRHLGAERQAAVEPRLTSCGRSSRARGSVRSARPRSAGSAGFVDAEEEQPDQRQHARRWASTEKITRPMPTAAISVAALMRAAAEPEPDAVDRLDRVVAGRRRRAWRGCCGRGCRWCGRRHGCWLAWRRASAARD